MDYLQNTIDLGGFSSSSYGLHILSKDIGANKKQQGRMRSAWSKGHWQQRLPRQNIQQYRVQRTRKAIVVKFQMPSVYLWETVLKVLIADDISRSNISL